MALQLRRGTDAERQLATFSVGEIIYTTDTKKVFVGDGTTVGGKFVGSFADSGLRTVITPDGNGGFNTVYETEYTADGHLVMDGNDITGVRNLAITGKVASSLSPNNSLITLGSNIDRWGGIFAANINVSNTISANTAGVHTGNVVGNTVTVDSSIVLNAESRELRGNVVGDNGTVIVNWQTNSFNGTLDGSVYGSVYGSDSSVVLDSFSQVLKLGPRTAEPTSPTVGMIAVADGNAAGWDPLGTDLGVAYPAFYNGTAWKAFTLSA
jgi:hypothetical protein